ncbi:hypothetical protein PQU94_08305 [Asticcacaulis sp. DXS10W]|uniref:Integrase n=1 Tax=Asticcacaulis currens TaxID=2984210 RepID=A0ABT5IDM4_9CAUL|nr:hypothetical protein [Asticcacaulis currens]MDC7694280.1 hypothetical protein [Asticcacaulis currens]
MANREGLIWNLAHDAKGLIPKDQRWNISRTRKITQGRIAWVRTLDTYKPAVEPFNAYSRKADLEPVEHGAMTREWIEFYLAVLLCAFFDGHQKPHSALCNIGQPIRILACCCHKKAPWELTPEDIRLAYNIALNIGESGKVAVNLQTVVRTIFDHNHLSDYGPMASYCTPFGDPEALSRHKLAEQRRRTQNTHRKAASRKSLAEKKDPEKLPDMEAFWELVRIVFTVKPRSFSDAVRFQLVALMIFSGFRVGEAFRVPVRCLRIREYFDRKGRNAAIKGGIGTSVQIRYFAEKQSTDRVQDGFVLLESFQDVPDLFANPISDIVERTRELTRRLRERLEAQLETGRLFPDLEPDTIVPDWDIYLRVSGNIQLGASPLPTALVEKYRETFSEDALDNLRTNQIQAYNRKPNRRIFEYFERWAEKGSYVLFRNKDGKPVFPHPGGRHYFRVQDIERYVKEYLPTKRPNLGALALSSGGIHYPHDFLFLFPTRSVVEDRDGGILDVGKYAFVGLGSELDLNIHLGLNKPNIFSRYGHPDAVNYKINPHDFRHLQNNELFRGGVSDALITLRFGRRSASQSHVYDHRTLAEELDYMEVPGGVDDTVFPGARRAFHLVSQGKVHGPIVTEFRRIQNDFGDQAAAEYIANEAGGLHVTPYGLCLSSLTVDPCPKQLECFNGCRHLARTGLPSETSSLQALEDRLISVIDKLMTQPATTGGCQNQLLRARTRLENVRRARAMAPDIKETPT